MSKPTETQFLPVKLTDKERKMKGEMLAKAVEERQKIEEEKKEANSTFTARLKASATEIRHLAKVVDSGQEYRDVPVRIEFFPRKGIANVYREDTGDLVNTRPMKEREYQREFSETVDEIFG